MNWFFLALLVPFLFAIVNLLDDNLLSFVYKSPYLATVFAGVFGSLPLLTRLFIHSYGLPFRLAIISELAGLSIVVFYFFYFKSLQTETPSVVIALFSLAPATIPFIAHFVVNERLTGMEIVGFVIVLIASLALSVKDWKSFTVTKALIPALVAVVFMDAESIMTKYAYQRADFYSVYLYFSAGLAVGALLFFLLRIKENIAGLKEIRLNIKKLLPIFIFAEATALLAEFTLNLAISRGPVSLVKVIESIQPMIVLMIAVIFFPLKPKYFREALEGSAALKFILMLFSLVGLSIIAFTQ